MSALDILGVPSITTGGPLNSSPTSNARSSAEGYAAINSPFNVGGAAKKFDWNAAVPWVAGAVVLTLIFLIKK